MKTPRKNTADEEARIATGIAQDPDADELTDAELAELLPAEEVAPELVAAYRRTRGPQKAPTKERITLHVDRDVVDALRKTGRGWQGRANTMLRQVVLKKR